MQALEANFDNGPSYGGTDDMAIVSIVSAMAQSQIALSFGPKLALSIIPFLLAVGFCSHRKRTGSIRTTKIPRIDLWS